MPARRPGAGALILTCGALLLLLLGVGNQLGGVQGVGGQGLRLQAGGGALWWGGWRTSRGGQGRGFVAPRQWRPAQGRLLGLQQPAICLVVQSAPFGLQAAVIPFFLSPLQAGTEKCKQRSAKVRGDHSHPTGPCGAGKADHSPPRATLTTKESEGGRARTETVHQPRQASRGSRTPPCGVTDIKLPTAQNEDAPGTPGSASCPIPVPCLSPQPLHSPLRL